MAHFFIPEPIGLYDNLDSKCGDREKCVAELQKTILGNIASSTQKSISDAEVFFDFFKIPSKLLFFNTSIRNDGSYVGTRIEGSQDLVGKIFYPTLECSFSKIKHRIEPYQKDNLDLKIKFSPTEIFNLIQSYEGCSVLMTSDQLSKVEIPIDYSGPIYHVWQRKPRIEFNHSVWNYVVIFIAIVVTIIFILKFIKEFICLYKKKLKVFFND